MESSPILLTCILSSLVAASLSLTCMECSGEDEKSCSGSARQCPEDANACVATYEVDFGKMEAKQYRRYCGRREHCSLTGSFSSSFGALKFSSSCCFTSNCAPSTPVLPSDKPEKNGVSCMDCQDTNAKSCTSKTYRDCTGDEKECVMLQSGEKSRGGCGTSGLCGAKLPGRAGQEPKEFQCVHNSGGAGLQHSLLMLVVIVPILLMRVIG